MYYLLLEKFNNYINRIYKSFDTVAEYIAYQIAQGNSYHHETTKKINFDTNNNIRASHIFNDNLNPDYLIWIDETTGNIVSRWFVISYKHTSGTQFRAELKRDSIADNYSNIIESPVFIEKGYVGNDDPAVFNHEDMTVNQIKTSETLLKDDSNTAWIVGFVAKDHSDLSNKTFTYNPDVDLVVTGNFTDWSYASIVDGTEKNSIDKMNSNNIVRFCLNTHAYLTRKPQEFRFNGLSSSYLAQSNANDGWICNNADTIHAYSLTDWYSDIDWDTVVSDLDTINSYVSETDYLYLKSLIGKNIQFTDGIYRISLTESYYIQENWTYDDNTSSLYTYLYGIVSSGIVAVGGTLDSTWRYPVAYKLALKRIIFAATKITNVSGTYTYSIPQTTKALNDAPYKMFAIPYYTGPKSEYVFSLDGLVKIPIDKDLMMNWLMSIIKELGISLYDVQILPYCPLSNWRGLISATRDGIWSMDKTVNIDYTSLLDSNNDPVAYCSWCDVSTKEDFIKYPIEVENYKIDNECNLYRLCSPNYSSVFEFSPSKNNGVEGYNIRFTYKPYQSFILVSPNYKGLYGKDFKDNRGLILAGDFSLDIISDAWTNYKLQNKNYQLAFDRQIENLEITQEVQRINEIFSSTAGVLKGGMAGGMAGGMVGGPYGAIAGAVVGTVASTVGGILDYNNNQRLRKETIDYTKDQFGYSLRNIQALPMTLNKVSSLIATSKFFPFVEFYTCTPEELQAFKDKIKYNGMSINRIGFIKDFLNPSDTTYIKGKLIRNTTIKCNADELLDIANELDKGVFI